ncbi:MAG TPA: sigma-54 dependent transcriptional regulator [Candidatus Acidoferrales bacterium]|nr:sigma-54 dependent transcriptional regulator [Candidatus Acidoferrales bacterium]
MATAEAHPAIRNSRVLVASSNELFRRRWAGRPEYEAVELEEAAGGADALAKLESANWGEVLLDRHLHDLDVEEVLRIIRARHPHLLVRVVDFAPIAPDSTDDGAVAAAVFPADVLRAQPMGDGDAAFRAENRAGGECELRIGDRIPPVEPLPGMMGDGPGLAQIYRLARLVGPRQTTVLITGETGTGKELVARGIHQIGPRAKSPFVVVNCAAIPEQLLEAELFGHARGAFTGAVQSRLGRIHVAQGGTLFLDEVGELPLSMQAKMLRFLQDGEVQRLGSSDVFRVDVRVISATNIDLLRSVHQKLFRQDLYYRLAVFPIELPPLRERKEDILPLAAHFLESLCQQTEYPSKEISPSAAAALRQFSWPGNVRELQHAIERAFILAGEERQLRPAHFHLCEAAQLVKEI